MLCKNLTGNYWLFAQDLIGNCLKLWHAFGVAVLKKDKLVPINSIGIQKV